MLDDLKHFNAEDYEPEPYQLVDELAGAAGLLLVFAVCLIVYSLR